MNLFLTLVIVAFLIFVVYNAFKKKSDEPDYEEIVYDLPSLKEFCKRLVDSVLTSDIVGDDEDYFRQEATRNRLRVALNVCMVGDVAEKIYVKLFFKDSMVKVYEFTDLTANMVIPFDRPERLTPKEKFDILMYYYKEKLGYKEKAFSTLVKKYNLDRLRKSGKDTYKYEITAEDIETIYPNEDINLTLDDKINIIVQRVYEESRGLGVIDELRDQDIDGVSGGSGGIPIGASASLELDDYLDSRERVSRDYDHVKVFFEGKTIRLSFLSFGSERELKRVCENIYTYGSPGQLNQQNGHKISEMADNSRVVVVGPKLADSYAFWVRKFGAGYVELEVLMKDEGNVQLLHGWLKWMARGGQTTGITGQQGSGKTTLLRAIVGKMYDFWNFRVQEGSAFELWLRKAFPNRDIITFREIPKVPGDVGLVIQKKTDGTINLIGEAAEDKIIAWIMKVADVASLCTWFTHHAQTAKALVDACRDALVALGLQSDPKEAEAYVVSKLKYNVHMENKHGHRYCSRITEYRPYRQKPYPTEYRSKLAMEEIVVKAMDAFVQWFQRTTDPIIYETVNIIEYRDGAYVAVERPSDDIVSSIKKNLLEEEIPEFEAFLNANWPVSGRREAS